jgi:hypothetical protein
MTQKGSSLHIIFKNKTKKILESLNLKSTPLYVPSTELIFIMKYLYEYEFIFETALAHEFEFHLF